MKTVFTDLSTIAHLWANQTQDKARNSSDNFYFNGDTIYSYGSHFPIAKHIVFNGKAAILFTERGYSNTTAKHIRIVQQAASHKNIIYCYNPESTHEQNFNSWLNDAESIAANLIKAKKPEKYLSQLSYVSQKANQYANFFELTISEKLMAILAISNKAEYSAYSDNKAAYEKAEKERQQKELQAKHKKELAKWLKGEGSRLFVRNGYDYLRLNDGRIETTQAVKIPLETGKKLWESIQSNTLTVGAKVLDHYTVESIGKEIRIGCHNFKKEYLINFGKRIFN